MATLDTLSLITQYTKEIGDLETAKGLEENALKVRQNAVKDWSTALSACKSGTKGADCRKSNQAKVDEYTASVNSSIAVINGLNSRILAARAALKVAEQKQEAENTINTNLSTQGVSGEALKVQADGVARAAEISAQNLSAAQGEAVLKVAAAEAAGKDNQNKVKMLIIIAVSALVITGLTIMVVRKVKSMKSKK